jgi:hypothetical protein
MAGLDPATTVAAFRPHHVGSSQKSAARRFTDTT